MLNSSGHVRDRGSGPARSPSVKPRARGINGGVGYAGSSHFMPLVLLVEVTDTGRALHLKMRDLL